MRRCVRRTHTRTHTICFCSPYSVRFENAAAKTTRPWKSHHTRCVRQHTLVRDSGMLIRVALIHDIVLSVRATLSLGAPYGLRNGLVDRYGDRQDTTDPDVSWKPSGWLVGPPKLPNANCAGSSEGRRLLQYSRREMMRMRLLMFSKEEVMGVDVCIKFFISSLSPSPALASLEGQPSAHLKRARRQC